MSKTRSQTITIGWTISNREAGYVAFMDGYQPFAKQYTETITVELPVNVVGHQVAELVFIATNAPAVDPGTPEEAVQEAIYATGYRGEQAAHFSLSVGDTVTVDDVMWACKAASWEKVSG
ncbi:hypothetical protein ACXJJ3_08630 [Kribbella sp. WER1]